LNISCTAPARRQLHGDKLFRTALSDGSIRRYLHPPHDRCSQGDNFQGFVVKGNHPVAEFRIDSGTMPRVASVLLLDFVNKRGILDSEKPIWFQSQWVERMALQGLVIGIAEPVLKHTFKL
jgi:hypothetical protein